MTGEEKSLPKEPSPGLLMSMALRYDHALGCPGYYDTFETGLHQKRLHHALSVAKQMYEEVSGYGFYSKEKEDNYNAMFQENLALNLFSC